MNGDAPKTAYMMPPPAPLEMEPQNLTRAPQRRTFKTDPRADALRRIRVFVPAGLATTLMTFGIHSWLTAGGMTGLEWFLLVMIAITFVWVALSVSSVAAALASLARPVKDTKIEADSNPASLDVAMLLPIYNETPQAVFGNAAAMLDDLARRGGCHRYTLFILSDTRDAGIAAQEIAAFRRLKRNANLPVFYRRRPDNTDKKVGNILDWVRGWGSSHEAMVVLDADSLMSGQAIEKLASALAADPDAGLIQSFPMLIGAETLFARVQQFSNVAYGWLAAEGLAYWSRSEGNYWGHNAILRTKAFAASAGLPSLRRGKRRDLILSHDFVEAGLLRRAGWRVKFLPRMIGSFEETPGTLIDHIVRDRRWCRGNLQHLRLLGTAGLHPVSRFHFLHGAVSYLLSPAWFILLIIWALLGKDADTNIVRYFNESNPMFPDWPPAMSHIDSAVFLVIMYAALLAPKVAGALIIISRKPASRLFGGRTNFIASVLIENLLSILYAPIMMIQQTKSVLRAIVSPTEPWAPQQRGVCHYSWASLLRFHWVETVFGIVLVAGLGTGLISLWLLPIAVSLICAVPLSAASALSIKDSLPAALSMNSPFTLREPAIVARARIERERFGELLNPA